ncbi:unnamed protein product [Aspergillus oryzae]|uniref:Unnamed protein product n=2 Tax=Aspergillus oryzae TaxID=5062 RepID=A0AAN4YU12_ASPOZ|nr:unnamed protein product [Aspergillus oryzae]GMF93128.1 unnamed protein product [Aspergillus oryzae]GMG36535.1 unnamed protein product [Aspergillus oryzae]GMG47048.1 unnamed protein product [Aspergillus oryzae var. brunneus]
MVDPDKIGLVDSDGVTTPDVLGVDIGDSNVPGNSQYLFSIQLRTPWLPTYWIMTFSTPLTIRRPLPLMTPLVPSPIRDLLELTVIPREPALSLVRVRETLMPNLVLVAHLLGHRGGGSAGLVVGAPVILVDGHLAGGASSPRSATSLRGGTLSVGEVESLAQNNHTGLIVTEVGDQLIGGSGVDGGGTATTSSARCEALRGARDTSAQGPRGEGGNGRKNSGVLHPGSLLLRFEMVLRKE